MHCVILKISRNATDSSLLPLGVGKQMHGSTGWASTQNCGSGRRTGVSRHKKGGWRRGKARTEVAIVTLVQQLVWFFHTNRWLSSFCDSTSVGFPQASQISLQLLLFSKQAVSWPYRPRVFSFLRAHNFGGTCNILVLSIQCVTIKSG